MKKLLMSLSAAVIGILGVNAQGYARDTRRQRVARRTS